MVEDGRRAIGIVRVSQVGGRSGESFASPGEQADRIRGACERDGLTLLHILNELDVSGGTPLDKRPALRGAIEAIEAGDADVIVAAYFDRLVRSLRVQDEIVSRVEHAGGQVMAVDVGRVTGGSAGQWLSSTLLGAVNEYQRRTTAERTAEALQRAIDRGAAPMPRVTLGYRRRPDGRLEPNPDVAPDVTEAFKRRAAGASGSQVRAYLAERGHPLTIAGVYQLMASRVVLGELHFGKFRPNLAAHEPIIGRDTWRLVQRTRVSAGRNTKSDRLLARLGVLRCGTCDSRLVASTATGASGKRYGAYQCQSDDCARRVTISARIAEGEVVAALHAEYRDMRGRASRVTRAREAAATAERSQAELDAAIRVLEIVGQEASAIERLQVLQRARDVDREEADRLGGFEDVDLFELVKHWDELSLARQRGAIRAGISRAAVLPGRGRGRVRVEFPL